jgi:hypothetical protein
MIDVVKEVDHLETTVVETIALVEKLALQYSEPIECICRGTVSQKGG